MTTTLEQRIAEQEETINAQKNAISKADARLKELSAIKGQNTKLRNADGVQQGKIKELTAEINKLNGDVDRHKAIAKNADAIKNRLELQIKDIQSDQGTACGGAFIVRTTQPRKVAGSIVDTGEVLGYITPCKGIETIELIHALHYRTAIATESVKHHAFVDSAKAQEDANALAEAKKQIEEMEAAIGEQNEDFAVAKKLLDEAGEENNALKARIEELEQELDDDAEEETKE